jgi:hypothetical protein
MTTRRSDILELMGGRRRIKLLIEEDIAVRRTANGLRESFFGFSRY